MANIKDYIWVLPLIGGILTLIGLLTPVMYEEVAGMGQYYWLWGLWYLDAGIYGTRTRWVFEMDPKEYSPYIFFNFFIHFIIFLILAIVITVSAVKARKEGGPQRFEKKWLAQGLALIIIAIIYLIDTEILMDWYYDKIGASIDSYWDIFDPGFAIIAPFLSGSLIIAGAGASKYVSKREVIPIKKKSIPTVEPSMTKEPKGFNYCPECGQRIAYKQSKYCSSCGFEFPH